MSFIPCAIIGLIIDAFSELRKKDDGVTEDLRNKCFICGLTKSDFGNPHQFDAHIGRHHSLRDYMYIYTFNSSNSAINLILFFRFFLLHLITKPETEFTGQVTFTCAHTQPNRIEH